MGTGSALDRADELHRTGDHAGSLDAARQGLSQAPDDVSLLRVAARCSSELGLDDASDLFRRVVELSPDEADAWAGLGTALLDQGSLEEAVRVFRTVLRLRPDDAAARINLAHALHATGHQSEAIRLLADAAADDPGNVTLVRSLVEMLRRADEPPRALDHIEGWIRPLPDDPVILLDLADLQLAAGRLDDAAATYRRLGEVDDEDHRTYAWHAMIGIEIRTARFRRALDLAIEATTLDRHQLTTDLLAFVAARLFGEGGPAVIPQSELLAALVAEQVEHRRDHLEALA